MNYFRQIYYEMRHQKMMTWVSVSGTALAIFLVMAMFMAEQVKTAEVAPELRRSRILTGANFHCTDGNGGDGSTSGLNYDLARRLYAGLDGIEDISFISSWTYNCNVNVRGQEAAPMLRKSVDSHFWDIYDFNFIDGRPFDAAEVDAGARKVVLSRSSARKLFGEDNVAGREIEINCVAYVVSGVVDDVNPLLGGTFSHFYVPFDRRAGNNDPYFGDTNVLLLMKEGVSAESVKNQVKSRYGILQSEMAKEGKEAIYHLQPYTSEEVALGGYGSNNEPDIASHRRQTWIIYAILLLLPAINLSCMTRSRLRHRVSEIGVRRAFGAKRSSIVEQLFGENLLITFIGGLLGLVLSFVFILFASHLFFQSGGLDPSSLELVNARPSLMMLFRWENFLFALGLCLVLNIVSATVPAWMASRVEPAVAISRSR